MLDGSQLQPNVLLTYYPMIPKQNTVYRSVTYTLSQQGSTMLVKRWQEEA